MASPDELLTDDMLARFDERAPVYDRENRFFTEDFDELKGSGYLNAAVPEDLGGSGLPITEVMRLQRRLAYAAPATAVAVNMHIYWTGVARDLLAAGDSSMKWILEGSVDGNVYAAGHGERGNDVPGIFSSAEATRADGGWEITGHKVFGSLSPVWTHLGVHAMDTSDPDNPLIVHAFMPRDAENYAIEETWDTLGMRATQSHDTILNGTFIPDELTPLVCPAGFAGVSQFHLSLFAWGLMGFGAVYLGAAQRAFDLTVEAIPKKTSVAMSRSMAHHPEVQHKVADMCLALETAAPMLERTVQDWADGVDHGAGWAIKLFGTKHAVTRLAFEVVDDALDLSGGAGIFKTNRIEMLFRDIRLGRIHPGSDMLTHEFLGKLSLGVDPDDPVRWG